MWVALTCLPVAGCGALTSTRHPPSALQSEPPSFSHSERPTADTPLGPATPFYLHRLIMSGTHLAGAAPLGPASAHASPSPQLDRPELCAFLGVLVMAIFPPITPRAPTLSTPSVGVDTVDTLDSRDFPLGPGWAELYPRSVLGCPFLARAAACFHATNSCVSTAEVTS